MALGVARKPLTRMIEGKAERLQMFGSVNVNRAQVREDMTGVTN